METTLNYQSIENQTAKAILVVIDGKKSWIAKSICKINEADKTITLPDWKAREFNRPAFSAKMNATYAKMAKEVAAAKANFTEEEKKADDEDNLRLAVYSHYDKKSGEYYAITKSGKRVNA